MANKNEVMVLVDDYAEARHRKGHSTYNVETAAARKAVEDALKPSVPKGAITSFILRDDSGDAPAFCVMVAYRTEADAIGALAALGEGLQVPHHGNPTGAELQQLHNLLYTAQRTTGHFQELAIRDARIVLSRMRAAPQAVTCNTPSYCSSVQRCTAQDELRASAPQPGAVYAELPEPNRLGILKYNASEMRDFADRTHALRQAAPKAAPAVDAIEAVLGDFAHKQRNRLSATIAAELVSELRAALAAQGAAA